MKRIFVLTFSIFLLFSCKTHIGDKVFAVNSERESSDGSRTVDAYSDEALVDYANSIGALVLASDGEFIITLTPVSNNKKTDYYYNNYRSKFYFSDNGTDWVDLVEFYASPSESSASTIGFPDKYISSSFNDNLGKYVLYIKGVNSGRFLFNFVSLHNTSLIGAYGNIENLIASDKVALKESVLLEDSAFAGVFKNCSFLSHAPDLPSDNLSEYCYNMLFLGCDNLATAPELPATTLADSCYYRMFEGCTSLKTAPELPAKSLKSYCYSYMFRRCISLTDIPSLPSTQLEKGCYSGMFIECSNMTNTSRGDAEYILPATELPSHCYDAMFYMSGIATPVVIKASAVDSGAMDYMFARCVNLPYIILPELSGSAANKKYNYIAESMFAGVAEYVENLSNPCITYDEDGYRRVSFYKATGLPDGLFKNSDRNDESYIDIFGSFIDGPKSCFDFENRFVINLNKEIKGYSKIVHSPHPDDFTCFSSKDPFVITPLQKTWDGELYYWDGWGFKLWDEYSSFAYPSYCAGSVRDCIYPFDYKLYLVGDNTVISDSKRWTMYTYDDSYKISLNVKLEQLMSYNNPTKKIIELGDNCFRSWFAYDTRIEKIRIWHDSLYSIVDFGESCFEDMFLANSNIKTIDIQLNKDELTYNKILSECSLSIEDMSDANFAFSGMFNNSFNLHKTSLENFNFSVYLPKIGLGCFANMFSNTAIAYPISLSYPEDCNVHSWAFYKMYFNDICLKYPLTQNARLFPKSAFCGMYSSTAFDAYLVGEDVFQYEDMQIQTLPLQYDYKSMIKLNQFIVEYWDDSNRPPVRDYSFLNMFCDGVNREGVENEYFPNSLEPFYITNHKDDMWSQDSLYLKKFLPNRTTHATKGRFGIPYASEKESFPFPSSIYRGNSSSFWGNNPEWSLFDNINGERFVRVFYQGENRKSKRTEQYSTSSGISKAYKAGYDKQLCNAPYYRTDCYDYKTKALVSIQEFYTPSADVDYPVLMKTIYRATGYDFI